MSKLGFTALLNRNDSILSPHFGKAKWIMIQDDSAGSVTFEQNAVLNGRAVVEILQQAGCTDVISAEVGDGALHHLQQAGIRSWIAPGEVPIPRILEMFQRGELAPPAPRTGGEAHHGCCHGTDGATATQPPGHKQGRCCCG